MTKETMERTHDGLMLHLVRNIVAQPMPERAVIVLVHGITANLSLHYDYFTTRLNSQGYTVYRYDHRGHGKSEGMRNFTNSWSDIVDDAKFMVDLAKSENPGKKIFVLGHSLGGATVTHLAARYPGIADGFVILSPMSYYSTECFGPLPKEGEKDKNLGFILIDAEKSGLDQDYAVKFGTDPTVNVEMTVGLANALYEAAVCLRDKDYTAKITDPVYLIAGQLDPFIPVKDITRLYNEISSEIKDLTIYSRVHHEIFNDPIKEEVTDDILKWLRKQIDDTLVYFK